MRHLKKGRKLGRTASHKKALLCNLATSLIFHERIQTTTAKAKELRPFFEPLITLAKRGDLHARRRVIQVLRNNKEAVHILFTEIAPQVSEREGGYTRITKLGYRKGDNAPMAAIELVLEPVVKKPVSAKKAAAAKAAAEAPKVVAPAAAPAVEASSEELVVTDGVVDEIVDAPVEAVAETTEAAVEEAAAPAEEAPAEEAPADEAPADEAPADEAPANKE
jgi:large subunit ribosomal protein L17